MKVIVTGGAGFIGSALVRHIVATTDWSVVNVDKLTYAGNLDSLASVTGCGRYIFNRVDICDRDGVRRLFDQHRPDAVIHLAAETHVDRSIKNPSTFVQTNVVGTCVLLDEAFRYYSSLGHEARKGFRFHHVSTDEVYGSLGPEGYFTETTPYAPNSPYSASKAASDHFVRAWSHTYGLPVLTTNCSNNYGPYQFPEKLIPLITLNALEGKPLPVYGEGDNVRDWLFVDDHVEALLLVLRFGQVGEAYNIGGRSEMTNIKIVHVVCDLIDELRPDPRFASRRELVRFVEDRPGHDKRYAIDASKIERELGWRPRHTFATGLRRTVEWFLANADGWRGRTQNSSYRRERLGRLPAHIDRGSEGHTSA